MKNRNIYFLALLVFIIISTITLYPLLYGKNSKINSVKNANTIKDFEICDIHDKCSNLSSYLDDKKYIVVNFGASWCLPCKVEIPEIITAAKNNPNIHLMIISVDHNRDDMLNFLKKSTSLNFLDNPIKNISIHMDSSTKIASGVFYTDKYPETYVIQMHNNNIVISDKFIGTKHNFNKIFASLK